MKNDFCPWNIKKLSKKKVEVTKVCGEKFTNRYGETRAVFYEGEPYRGKPTKVFAYIGMPDEDAPRGGYPAVVLVHGGGGAAFFEWVEYWNSKGYAAIAIDHSGSMFGSIYREGHNIFNPEGGPQGYNPFKATKDNYKDEWIYHAVADTILANNILRNTKGVNRKKIALTGISWGGVITAIVSGIDNRFMAFAPYYGGGFLDKDEYLKKSNGVTEVPDADEWRKYFDPSSYVPKCKRPIMTTLGMDDPAFPAKLNSETYKLNPNTFYSYRFSLPHGHRWRDDMHAYNVYRFINSFVDKRDEMPFVVIGSEIKNNRLYAYVNGVKKVYKATFVYTASDMTDLDNKNSEWYEQEIVSGKIMADIPHGTTACFIELTDGRKKDFIMSTEIHYL